MSYSSSNFLQKKKKKTGEGKKKKKTLINIRLQEGSSVATCGLPTTLN